MFGIGSRKPKTSTGLRRYDERNAAGALVREDELAGLLGAIRSSIAHKRPCSIGVISTLPGEGVTTIAQGLAAVAARSSRTKVLLCKVPDEASASAQASPLIMMEMLNGEPGDRLVVGRLQGAPLAQAMSGTPGSEQAIVRSLASSFDIMIAELPPISISTLGPSLARGLDGVLLVVEAERTRTHAIRAARKSIELYGGTVIGAVLNKRRYHIPQAVYRFL
jgi:protein-tyrosine kinase